MKENSVHKALESKHIEYTKIRIRDIVYYVSHNVLDEFLKEKNKFNGIGRNTRMIALSDFIINAETNELIKCRYTFESVFDEFTKLTSF